MGKRESQCHGTTSNYFLVSLSPLQVSPRSLYKWQLEEPFLSLRTVSNSDNSPSKQRCGFGKLGHIFQEEEANQSSSRVLKETVFLRLDLDEADTSCSMHKCNCLPFPSSRWWGTWHIHCSLPRCGCCLGPTPSSRSGHTGDKHGLWKWNKSQSKRD